MLIIGDNYPSHSTMKSTLSHLKRKKDQYFCLYIKAGVIKHEITLLKEQSLVYLHIL